MRKIKLVLSLLLIAAMMLPLCACGSTVVPVGDLNATVTGSGSVDGFEYNTYSDGTVGITKYTGGYTRHTVPAEINGMQVSRIEEKAYFNCNLVKVTIPDSVIWIGDSAFELNQELAKVDLSDNCLYIGARAFYNCKALKSIDIPQCLESIGPYAFTLTKWIEKSKSDFLIIGQGILIKYWGHDKEVTIPDDVRFISTAFSALNGRDYDMSSRLEKVNIGPNVEIIGESAFNLCCYLADITIPETVTYIGPKAFAECIALTSLDLPASITRIEDYTFYACEGFTEYNIPDNIEYVGANAFAKCLNLKKLTFGSGASYIDPTVVLESDYLEELIVSPENDYYSAEDLCLYSKDQTVMYYYHKYKTDTEFSIPDTVVTIEPKAFAGSENIVELYCSEALESIGLGVFDSCINLRYIHFSDKLQFIDNSAFLNCPSLTEVYYSGSRDQWSQVEIGVNNLSFELTYVNYDWIEE